MAPFRTYSGRPPGSPDTAGATVPALLGQRLFQRTLVQGTGAFPVQEREKPGEQQLTRAISRGSTTPDASKTSSPNWGSHQCTPSNRPRKHIRGANTAGSTPTGEHQAQTNQHCTRRFRWLDVPPPEEPHPNYLAATESPCHSVNDPCQIIRPFTAPRGCSARWWCRSSAESTNLVGLLDDDSPSRHRYPGRVSAK